MNLTHALTSRIDRRHSFVARYGIALLVAAAVGGLRVALIPWMGTRPPYITFYLGILIAAVLGGIGPGLLVTAIGVLFGFMVLPAGPVAFELEAVRLALYLMSGLGISLTAEAMHRHRRKEQEKSEELAKAKAALEESLARLEAVIQSMSEALVISDLDGTILSLNPSALRLHGFDTIDQGRRHIQEYPQLFEIADLDGRPLPIEEWPISRAIRGEVFSNMEIRVHRRDNGLEFIGSYSGTPVQGPGGEIRMAILTIRDVTAQKQAEEELKRAREAAEEANRAKSEFLAKMSHEIRTPMTVVLGSIDHLLESGATPEQRPLLDMAEMAAQRLLATINDVLDISKIEASRIEIDRRPFDLRDCVAKAVGLFAISARDKGIRLHWRVAEQLPSHVEGDPDRLAQVLVNLVGNAVKFTAQGEVAVEVSPESEGVGFAVRDTGIGIPEDHLTAIFEPFNQGGASRTRQYGGTGLGLSIARELVQLMGGRIRAESSEGRGSTFIFSLPLPGVDPLSR